MNQMLKSFRNDLLLNNLTKILIQIQIQIFKQTMFVSFHQYINYQNMLNKQFIYSMYLFHDFTLLIIDYSYMTFVKYQTDKIFFLNEFLQIYLKFF